MAMVSSVYKMQWEAPATSRKGKVKEFVAGLKSRPGVWAVYNREATSSSTSYARAYPGTQWTTVTNRDAQDERTGTMTQYARWVGVDEKGKTAEWVDDVEVSEEKE